MTPKTILAGAFYVRRMHAVMIAKRQAAGLNQINVGHYTFLEKKLLPVVSSGLELRGPKEFNHASAWTES